MLGAVRQADQRQRLHSPFVPFLFADLGIERGQFRVFQCRGARQQIESLKNKSDFLIADKCQRPLVVLQNVNAFQQIAPGTGPVQAPENIHERGFPAAARAHHGHKLAALHFDAHAAQRVHARFAQFVIFVNILNANDGTLCGGGANPCCFGLIRGVVRDLHGVSIQESSPPDPLRARRRRFCHDRANDQFISFFQIALRHRRHFRIRVVGDA